MDFDGLFNHKAFTELEPEQLKLIRQFAADSEGKGAAEIARLYMQVNKKVNQIKPVTTAQRSAIVEAIKDFLPEPDRQKFSGLLKVLVR